MSTIQSIINFLYSPSKPIYLQRYFFLLCGLTVLVLILTITLAIQCKTHTLFLNTYIESTDKISNPDIGFYYQEKVWVGTGTFNNQTSKADQIYRLLFDISEFSSKNNNGSDIILTDFALKSIDEFLFKIKSENRNGVARFYYDKNYSGTKDLEPSMDMIITHIKQLSPIINKHTDTISAIEAGMLGPWGEMHSSVIATNENKAKVIKCWLDNTKNVPILSRYPPAIYTYFNKTFEEMENYTISSKEKGYKISLFNDCFMSSENDVGTYTKNLREREIDWLYNLTIHLPFGGETCRVHDYNEFNHSLSDMRRLHLSYLNSGFHKDVLGTWQNATYNKTHGNDSLFYGVNGLDYVYAHIGYRFVILSSEIKYKKISNSFDLKVIIKNVGFGNLFKEKKLGLIYTDMNDTVISKHYNLGTFNGENEIKINCKFISDKNKEYKVYLIVYGSVEKNIIYYPIRFGNINAYNPNIKANLLFKIKNRKIEKSEYIIV